MNAQVIFLITWASSRPAKITRRATPAAAAWLLSSASPSTGPGRGIRRRCVPTVLSVADVELPDGVRFEQYVLRVPAAAMVVVLNNDQVLMMRRHRFIIDRWVWELPGGYLARTRTRLRAPHARSKRKPAGARTPWSRC
jgi:hypothetical protein